MVDSLRDRSAKVLLEKGHVVPVVDRLSLQRELLAEQVEQMGERVDGVLLGQSVPAPGFAEELS